MKDSHDFRPKKLLTTEEINRKLDRILDDRTFWQKIVDKLLKRKR